MASISARNFEFVRGTTNGGCEMMAHKEGAHKVRLYDLDLKARVSYRYTGEKYLLMPTKITAAMIHACILFDRDYSYMRQKWRPRWPV